MRDATEEEKSFFQARGAATPAQSGISRGCESCEGDGYFGRTGIFEVWNLEEKEYEAILRGQDERFLRDEVEKEDYSSLLADARSKVESGITSVEELLRANVDLPWEG